MTARIIGRRISSPVRLAALGLSLAIHGSALAALVLWRDGPQPRPVGGAAAIAVMLVTGPGARPAALARRATPGLTTSSTPTVMARLRQNPAAVAPPRQPDAVMPPRPIPKALPIPETRLVPKMRPAPPSIRPHRRRSETARIARRAATSTSGTTVATADGTARRGGRGAAPLADNPPPVYPWRARQRGYQGRVVLRVRVRANGSSAAIAVFKSSGYAVLDRAAVHAVRKWRFAPARSGGVAISSIVAVPVRFRLEN